MSEGRCLPPRATYRLQLGPSFTFADAARQAEYLAGLNVSHVYLSPILAARAGSPHGYDVVDHDRLSPDLGTLAQFRAMVATFHQHGLGVIVDLVPNHMGIGPENRRWMDVLRWGRAAENARFFDIDWTPQQPYLDGKILLPVLDRPLKAVLDAREIEIAYEDEGFIARWRGQVWPITPPSLSAVGRDGLSVAAELSRGPPDRLRQLLARQCWYLAEWQRAAAEINYRRFFAINDLAAIRVEDAAVFDTSHELMLRLVEEGAIDGLRIDHIDGLADPKAYLEKLSGAMRERGRLPYIWVEKILAEGETLPDSWPVAGTTGYDRLGAVDRLFCEGEGAARLVDRYRRITGRDESLDALLGAAKRRFLETNYISEINRLARVSRRLAGALSDRPIEAFRRAWRALIVALPVYRSYVDRHGPSAADRWWLDAAFDAAGLDDPALADFLRAALSAQDGVPPSVAILFQQISGPAMAKGMEDTVFYRYVPLLALNEVGGSPDTRPMSVAAFHALNQTKLRTRPDDLIAGSTHDTKRGEDARARLLCLTSAAGAFETALERWFCRTDGDRAIHPNDKYYLFQTMLGAWPPGLRPDDGAGLAEFAVRIRPAMRKAVREAKERSQWTRPNEAYEAALDAFVASVLDPGRSADFLADFATTAERFGFWGALTSLSATLLRLTIPGVPDLFQGAEGWNLSLVDPDNRRAVDFSGAPSRLVRPLPTLGALAACWHDGAVKTGLIRAVLEVRRRRPELFARGDYQPLQASGEAVDCLVAFARTDPTGRMIVLAPRFWPKLWPDAARKPRWGGTAIALPPGEYVNCLTGAFVAVRDGEEIRVADLLDVFPCALLATRGAS